VSAYRPLTVRQVTVLRGAAAGNVYRGVRNDLFLENGTIHRVNAAVDILINRGLIRRAPGFDGARRYWHPTEAGRQYLEALDKPVTDH